MIAGDLPDIPEYMDIGSLKVHAPSSVVIVCGGRTYLDYNTPIASLRDAFFRVRARAKLSKLDIRKAEDFVRLPRPGYDNLLQLESDISQISELVLLFTESAGSLAELGVFTSDEEIISKLLVVVDKINYEKDSFIRYGPLQFLEQGVGDKSVCAIDLQDHGSKTIENVSNLNLDTFYEFIAEKVEARLGEKREPSSFNKKRNGHLIKLITGLVQNYAALTLDEIDFLLYCLEIPQTADNIRKLLGCAELFGWIRTEKEGLRTFHSATDRAMAINFRDLAGHKVNRTKWRVAVLEHWKASDRERFKCISNALGSSRP